MTSSRGDDVTDLLSENERQKAVWQAGARAFGGRCVTPEENEASRKRLHGDGDSIKKKYPGSNGCEMAMLGPNGEIEILHSSTAGDFRSHGTRTYAVDDKHFQYFWKRHDFDNPKNKTHVIMKRFDEASKEWIDIGQDWI